MVIEIHGVRGHEVRALIGPFECERLHDGVRVVDPTPALEERLLLAAAVLGGHVAQPVALSSSASSS